ncbi:MAG: DoxX family protein [Hyphomicrobiales bacterium]
MDALAPYLITLGRLLLAPVFLQSGISKIFDYAGTRALMEAHGLPGILLVPTVALELLAGIGILLGLWTRCAALALAIFCVVAAVVFHLDFGDRMQTIQFLENVAMAGGLLALAGAGSGAFALDNRR